MHIVYIRLIAYALSTLAGMIPAAWAGWITYDAAAGMLHVSIEGLAGAMAAGLAMSAAVFARWGVREGGQIRRFVRCPVGPRPKRLAGLRRPDRKPVGLHGT